MFKHMYRHLTRQPVPAIAVLLFAAVLTVVLCQLHKNRQEELQSYQEAYAAVPVFFKVTDLDGSTVKEVDGIDGWVVDLFDEYGLKPNLLPYTRELHIRVSISGRYFETDENGFPLVDKYGVQTTRTMTLTGVSSTRVAQELTEGWGGKIYWNEGYDENILMSDEFVCLLPEALKGREEIEMYFVYSYNTSGAMGDTLKKELTRTFQVVGYYTDPGNSRIYCPYATMEWIHAYLTKSKNIEEIGAILNDNTKIDALKETIAMWFAEPNPMGRKTEWGRYSFDYYLYAMDVDDSMLTDLSNSMKNSLRLNELASAVVFALSAGAGFLTGFLVIRSRKREIALMRTVGSRQISIFLELVLEQVLCIAVGIALGGSYTAWEPRQRLILFGVIYSVGLIVALTVFLRSNLLTSIKEED